MVSLFNGDCLIGANFVERTTVRSRNCGWEGAGSWNHLMSELTPEPDSIFGENKKKNGF
jgi:hypothetical protein